MRRSEAIKKIKSIIATRGPTQPTIDTAEQVLDMLEQEVGMLPPYNPQHLDHGAMQDCQWDPEESYDTNEGYYRLED